MKRLLFVVVMLLLVGFGIYKAYFDHGPLGWARQALNERVKYNGVTSGEIKESTKKAYASYANSLDVELIDESKVNNGIVYQLVQVTGKSVNGQDVKFYAICRISPDGRIDFTDSTYYATKPAE